MKIELVGDYSDYFKRVGDFASVCYDSDGNMDKIGKHCVEKGHYSPTRHLPFTFEISEISRACANQLVRHTEGVTFNQRSQRYVDEYNFGFVIPPSLKDGAGMENSFKTEMHNINEYYEFMVSDLIAQGKTHEQAREDARYVLPNCCWTKVNMTMTLEALMNFYKKRGCLRAQWEIRELAIGMTMEVSKQVPDLINKFELDCGVCTDTCPGGKNV